MDSYSQSALRFNLLSSEVMSARAREFCMLLQGRRSVRSFSDRPVSRDLVEQAILTAGTAPSGAHREPWHFVAVSDPEIKSKIRKAAEKEERESYERRMSDEWLAALQPLGTDWQKPFLDVAPWLVVCFAKNVGDDGKKNYYVQESCGIACGLFIAAIHNLGLVTLTHTPSPMRFLGEILNRPKHERAFILFPVGYPAENAMVPNLTRKSKKQLITWEEGQKNPRAGP
ncbi:MAG: nitroreductase family protein [Bacteroidetes bacterium]|nr:nitroreductase family protein [Bacteroidota bacterium]MCY4204907.1 nitroreductase family protein [Bacteroidota bacterium]